MSNGATGIWSSNLIRELGELVKKGLSAGQIAKLFGVTRNTVMGKIHREGFKLAREPNHTLTPEQEAAIRAKRQAIQAARLVVWKEREEKKRKSLAPYLDLPVGTDPCQWLEGEPEERKFCGCNAVRGKSWCPEHYARVFDIQRTVKSAKAYRSFATLHSAPSMTQGLAFGRHSEHRRNFG